MTIRQQTILRAAAVLALLGGAAACADDPAPPFEVEGTGALAGRVFFDANRNGVFDPLGGDSALAGIPLAVRERGTERVFTGAAVTSDADGSFRVPGLPLGTHDLFVDTLAVPEGSFFCQNPLPATIYSRETQYRAVIGRNGCVILIGEAEALPAGSFVTLRGVVTVAPGQIRNDYTYIEESSGGVRLFGASLAGQGLEVGDRIEISGTLTAYNGEWQISTPVINETEKAVTVPAPREVTTGEIAAAAAPSTQSLQGRLVRVRAAKLLTGFVSGGSRNARLDDGSGAIDLRVETGQSASSGEAITSQFEIGACYDIVGVVGSFREAAQLFPRTLAEMTKVACE